MPTDAPTPDDLAAIRARHVPTTGTVGPYDLGTYCRHCCKNWPCDAARLLAALDRETAHWRAAEDDLAALAERAEAAEVRLPTKGGGTLVVTAVELYAAHEQARAIAERARFWAAGWRRAAYDRRDLADLALDAAARADERLAALQAEHDALLARAAHAGLYPAEVAAVVADARRAVAGADYRFPLADLRAALVALDVAQEGS